MFQMMNEARIMVGLNGVATASVAYHESLAYARDAPAGPPARRASDPARRRCPIIEHADVRRMLLRQKAIVEGGLALVGHGRALRRPRRARDRRRASAQRAQLLLDLLTPVAKSFPAEKGFEANALAVQIHGGYGYSSEYLPEAWLRDQKLNSIHEGTTGIQGTGSARPQGGRRRRRGAACARRGDRAHGGAARARAGVDRRVARRAASAPRTHGGASSPRSSARAGMAGDVERMLRHSADYLELFSMLVRRLAVAAQAARPRARGSRRATGGDRDFYEGKLARGAVLDRHRAAARAPPGGAVPRGRGLVRAHAARVVLTRMSVSFHLCQPGRGASCGACCGLYNFRDHSRARLTERLALQTDTLGPLPREPGAWRDAARGLLAARDAPPLFPAVRVCPLLGFLDAERTRVGCLGHPKVTGGEDLRDCGVYRADICETFTCPSFTWLTDAQARLVQAACADWYLYGLVITDVEFVRGCLGLLEWELAGPGRTPRPSSRGPRRSRPCATSSP